MILVMENEEESSNVFLAYHVFFRAQYISHRDGLIWRFSVLFWINYQEAHHHHQFLRCTYINHLLKYKYMSFLHYN